MSADLEERAKRNVGRWAVDTYVRRDTCIGLGSGSTALYAIQRAGELAREGWNLRAVATSAETGRLCREYGIALRDLTDEPIDVAIDGADEVAADWSLTKGGGGALFREKAVAIAAHTFVVIVTERKCVAKLGAFPLPIEVVPFSRKFVTGRIEALGAQVTLRERDGAPFATDNGNVILDCKFRTIAAPAQLEAALRNVHGVVATGLFVGLTSRVMVGYDDGTIVEPARAT
jgi:ribose 5-phosphate isomerase A